MYQTAHTVIIRLRTQWINNAAQLINTGRKSRGTKANQSGYNAYNT